MSSEIPVVQYGQPDKSAFINSWWSLKDDLAQNIFAKVNAMKENQSPRRRDWLRFARLYTNTEFDYYLQGVVSQALGKKISFNVCKACVDTAASKYQRQSLDLFS